MKNFKTEQPTRLEDPGDNQMPIHQIAAIMTATREAIKKKKQLQKLQEQKQEKEKRKRDVELKLQKISNKKLEDKMKEEEFKHIIDKLL